MAKDVFRLPVFCIVGGDGNDQIFLFLFRGDLMSGAVGSFIASDDLLNR